MKKVASRITLQNRIKISEAVIRLLDKQSLPRHEIRSKLITVGANWSVNDVINLLIAKGDIVEENGLIKIKGQ